MAKKRNNSRLVLLLALAIAVALLIWLLPDGAKAGDIAEHTAIAAAVQADATNATEQDAEIAASTLVKVGDKAPDFTVEMLDGSRVKLSSLRGKVVLVNFWATWCPPCREELKHVQKEIADRFAGKEFAMIAISRGEKRDKVAAFIADNGYAFPVGLDQHQTIFRLFATNYIPRNFIVDADGRIAFVGVGYDAKEFAEMVAKIDETIKKQ